ncbi:MAG: M20/M25/M40 family metallo-hydrolase [Acidobacteria bacterium]|nr:M20/M25/M40 family metallo-hydrolase [Acidobacteriota bacterium]
MTRRLMLTGLAVGLAFAGLAAQGDYDVAASRQLAGATLVYGRSFEYVRELTDTFGARLTGTAGYERAAAWAAAQFRAAGIANVATETFTIERSWERGSARARVVAPIDRSLHVQSLGWTPSTPEGGMEAEVALVTGIGPGTIAGDASLAGRIALVDPPDAGGDAAQRFSLRQQLAARLRAAQAIAMLSPDGAPDNVLAARSGGSGTGIGVLPAAQIGREDAALVRRLLGQGPVRLAIDWHNRISPGPAQVSNIVAELRGRERPDEWVIVGAHLDSWDLATGAQDNATGVAMVLDAARAIAALPTRPRRSIRFALWGGEEQGLLGSLAYVAAHAGELARCVATINTDGGSGRVRGFFTPGREDVAAAMRPLSRALLSDLGAAGLDPSMRYAFQTDVGPFILHGIPALDLDPDDVPYERVHHKANDVLDNVNRHDLSVGAAAVAIAAYAIADAPRPIAAALDRPGVGRMLVGAGLDRVLQLRGWWTPGP